MEFQYVNLSHEYKVIAPKNSEAMEKLYRYDIYDESGEIDSCFESMTFYEDSYYPLENILFDPINANCDSLINMYEEEVIEYDRLNKVKEVVDGLNKSAIDSKIQNLIDRFIDLLNCAITNETGLGFCF